VEILESGGLFFWARLARGTVTLTDGAGVSVMLNDGGTIGVTAGDLHLTEGSQLLAGIDTAGGTATRRAGDVVLDATGIMRVEAGSRIQNALAPEITGNVDNVQIGAAVLQVTGGSQLGTSTFGTGNFRVPVPTGNFPAAPSAVWKPRASARVAMWKFTPAAWRHTMALNWLPPPLGEAMRGMW
jgi:hypothetical protein